MKTLIICCIIFYLFHILIAAVEQELPSIQLENFDSPNFYYVEHSFDLGKSWKLRGTLRYHIQHKKFYYKGISNKWTTELLAPISTATNLYQIRFISSSSNNNQIIQTSISLCDLVESNFREEFRIVTQGLELQSIQYNVMGLANRRMIQIQKELECMQNIPSISTLVQLNMKQHVKISLLPTAIYKPIDDRNFAVQVDGISVQQQANNLQTGSTTTTTTEEPGFFRKYWMYIVPGVVIFMVMSAMNNPQ